MISLSLFDPVYTFVADDGTNTHIAVRPLREFCFTSGLEVFQAPVEAKIANMLLRENSVSPARLRELVGRELDPIIYAKDGTSTDGAPDVMLVDGHHRYVLAAAAKMPYILAYFLEESQWRPFEIKSPLLDTTREALIATPILPRKY